MCLVHLYQNPTCRLQDPGSVQGYHFVGPVSSPIDNVARWGFPVFVLRPFSFNCATWSTPVVCSRLPFSIFSSFVGDEVEGFPGARVSKFSALESISKPCS